MFSNCFNLLGSINLNLSNVANVCDMFRNCRNISGVGDINVPKANSLMNLFYQCRNLQTINSMNTINVVNMWRYILLLFEFKRNTSNKYSKSK